MSVLEIENLDGYRLCHFAGKDVLRERRKILDLTQQAVADRAGIRLQNYQNFEMGTRDIMNASFRTACKVIEALEMDVTDFFHGEYHIGEELMTSEEGLRFKKTGKLIDEDVE